MEDEHLISDTQPSTADSHAISDGHLMQGTAVATIVWVTQKEHNALLKALFVADLTDFDWSQLSMIKIQTIFGIIGNKAKYPDPERPSYQNALTKLGSTGLRRVRRAKC
jgi:hypothetical protein